MSETPMNVEQWVEVFRATGLDDAQMHRWHEEFERRYPEGHQSFLEWLGVPAADVRRIRDESRTTWKS